MKTLVLPYSYASIMIKLAYPERRIGSHFKKPPLRALKFLGLQPTGSLRQALDPELSDEDFDRIWHARRQSLFLGLILPFIVAVSRVTRFDRLIEWVGRKTDSARQERMDQARLEAHRKHVQQHLSDRPMTVPFSPTKEKETSQESAKRELVSRAA